MNTAQPSAPRAPGRYLDLVEQLRAEFDAVVRENREFRTLRDDVQRKIQEQVAELTGMERQLAELERHVPPVTSSTPTVTTPMPTPPVLSQPPPAHPSPQPTAPSTQPSHPPLPSSQPLPQRRPQMPAAPRTLPSRPSTLPSAAPQPSHPPQLQQPLAALQHPAKPELNAMLARNAPKPPVHSPARAQMIPEGTSQIPSYPSSLQTPFSRNVPSHPHQLQHAQSTLPQHATAKFPQRLSTPTQSLPPQQTQHLHGASAQQPLPSPPLGAGPAPNIPSMLTNGNGLTGPTGPSRALAANSKLHAMGIMSSQSPDDVMAHASLQKDHLATGRTPALLANTLNGQGTMSPSNRHPGLNNPQQAPPQQGAQGLDNDYTILHTHGTNGATVPNVSLASTLSHDSVVCCVRYSWDGQYLATGSNRSAHIFDAATGQSVATFSKDTGTDGRADDSANADSYVRAVCFSPDGNWLITGAEDHVVKVWDVRNRKVKHRLVGHDTDIYSVDASANSQFIISGSGDKKAKLWSLETGKLLSTLGGEHGPTDGITSVSVSPTSQHVAAGSLDKIVRVWDVESSRLVRQFEGHADSVYSVAFSPDGRMLLSGSLDRTLKLWDLAASQPSSQCRLSFTGHNDFVLSVAFSPNGRWLISGSKDRTVQFWDPRQSTAGLVLQGHKNSVISIAHNPSNNSLATGSGDFRARMWMYT